MKKIILALAVMFVVQEVRAQDFVVTQRKHERPKPKIVFIEPRVDGAIPRAVRLGNPLQMLNPFAPREYGDGREFVYYDESDPAQAEASRRPHSHGFKLLSFEW